MPRDDQSERIAADHRAGLVDDQRPVAVAIGGDEAVKPVFTDPTRRKPPGLLRHGFGVDRDEGLRPAEPKHLGAGLLQDGGQDVARRGAVLVEPDAQAAKRRAGHEAAVARDESLSGDGRFVAQGRRSRERSRRQARRRR